MDFGFINFLDCLSVLDVIDFFPYRIVSSLLLNSCFSGSSLIHPDMLSFNLHSAQNTFSSPFGFLC